MYDSTCTLSRLSATQAQTSLVLNFPQAIYSYRSICIYIDEKLKLKKFIGSISLSGVVLISACSNFPLGGANEKRLTEIQNVTIDGQDLIIAEFEGGWRVGIGSIVTIISDPVRLKATQVKAVELHSRCKVNGAEWFPSTYILAATVACN